MVFWEGRNAVPTVSRDSGGEERESRQRFAKRIADQIEKIAMSSYFANAGQSLQMLRYVVTEKLAGRQNEIKEYTVGAFGLGLGVEFDPEKPNVVRQVAGHLRTKLDQYYANPHSEDEVIVKLPARGYISILSFLQQGDRLYSTLFGVTVLSLLQ